jgi:hypothetical protein
MDFQVRSVSTGDPAKGEMELLGPRNAPPSSKRRSSRSRRAQIRTTAEDNAAFDQALAAAGVSTRSSYDGAPHSCRP